jgi:hypothetical protein
LKRSPKLVIAGLDPGLDPAIPIIRHIVASPMRAETLCSLKRDRRVKPGDDGVGVATSY